MSLTHTRQLADLLYWLDTNAFWNIDRLELDISPTTSGIGVFYVPLEQDQSTTEDQNDDEDDNLLLRIPKSNILSPKNSVVWNLLVDYDLANADIDLTTGLHSIVLTFIYELAQGSKSPWYHYLQSIAPEEEDSITINNLPLCLWPSEYKKKLYNTEYYYLDMLKSKELVDFYVECVRFARCNESFIAKPTVFDVSSTDELDIMRDESDKVTLFGSYVQVVISRAFEVDDYHGLSLVPGADLFNHASAELNGDGRIEGREDVHFVCDGDVCGECGEFECDDHEEETEEEMEEEMEEEEMGEDDEVFGEDDEEKGEDSVHEDDGEDSDSMGSNFDSDNELLQDSGISDQELYSTSDDDLNDSLIDESEVRSDVSSYSDENSSTTEEEPIKELTMDYVQALEEEIEQERESELETDHDPEEASTTSLGVESDEEDEPGESEVAYDSDAEQDREELAKELADGSKCCDIVLSRPPKHTSGKYELFNTYGNHLSNPYLLQRYGFITQDQNVNDVVSLGSELVHYIKKFKAEQSPVKVKQLENKISWYDEMGFEFVNDLVCEYESRPALDDGDDDDEEQYDEHTQIMRDNLPESYVTSPRLDINGKMTPQTYALAKLLVLPYKIFHYKFIECASERKLAKRIFQILLPYEYEPIRGHQPKHSDKYGAEINQLVKLWCGLRLGKYVEINDDTKGDIKLAMVKQVVQQEKEILKKALGYL